VSKTKEVELERRLEAHINVLHDRLRLDLEVASLETGREKGQNSINLKERRRKETNHDVGSTELIRSFDQLGWN